MRKKNSKGIGVLGRNFGFGSERAYIVNTLRKCVNYLNVEVNAYRGKQ
jgi:hypothetical protein